MAEPRALLFGLDALAETEEAHRQAFNEAFAAFDLPWVWSPDHYRELLRVDGDKARILHHARVHDRARLGARLEDLCNAVDARYAAGLRMSGVALRPGVRRLVSEAVSREVRLAIVTTAGRAVVEALLDTAFRGLGASLFDVCIWGEDFGNAEPYAFALGRLGLAPSACVALEALPNGLAAARAAGLRTVVTPSPYAADEGFAGASLVVRHLDHGVDGEPLTIDAIAALETRAGVLTPAARMQGG